MDLFIKVPEDVQFIIDTLTEDGYEAYIVGGCVRDSILKRNINDWDMTTSAKPEEVVRLFDKVILTGIEHGTVTIVLNDNQYEVTTFRNDGEYDDNRHPVKVEFVNDLKEDLARRDFTINAMAYNRFSGLQDYFNGMNDLKNRTIKTVGNAKMRFNEDALRMMRAVRFSAQLDFDIDTDTLKAINEVSLNIESISKERIRDEFNKILLSNPEKIGILKDYGLLNYIIPELIDMKYNNILTSKEVKDVLHLRLAAILMDLGESTSLNILKRLKYDNDTVKKVISLITYQHTDLNDTITIKKLMNNIGIDLTYDLIELKRGKAICNKIENKNRFDEYNEILSKINNIIKNKECYSLKQLNINGNDLINLGFNRGKDIGSVLKCLLDIVIEDPKSNDKDKLLEIVYRIKNDKI
ncbi:MAG: CCA tRNA nucleotidyltransferase [Clostridium sp.]|nr:CCA tRNA nucleotidyltransferase [Clostridium sp.]